jgi:serine/threonine-protein kinase
VFGDVAAGSPYYMAPEQARHEPVDRRADVFSLGVVLYELLTNVKPFRGTTLDEITSAVITLDPPLASVVDPAVPEALALIAAKAMAKTPDDRHRSARAFSRELRHWLEENAVGADDETPGHNRQLRWLGAAAVAALVVGGLLWATLPPRRAAAPAPSLAAASAAPVAAVPAPDAASATAAELAAAAPVLPAASEAVATTGAPTPLPAAVTAMAAAPAAGQTATPATPAAVATKEPGAAKALSAPKETPKETPKEKRTREALERDAKAAPLTTAAPAPAGLVRIAVSPWGEIEVDGKAAGSSPPLTELSLPQGKHLIVIRNTDLPSFSTVVNVTADQPVNLKHKF